MVVVPWVKKNISSIIFLSILVILSFGNTINNTFISDDVAAIPQNPKLGNFNSVLNQPFAFIQPLIYFIIFHVGGTNPIPYHLINILFHLGVVIALYALVTKMTNQTVGFFSSSIFAVHPLLTEAVTWISGGNYIRYTFFFLISFLSYIHRSINKKYYLLSLFFFILCLTASEKAISLPLIYFLYEWLFNKKRDAIKYTFPFFICSGSLVLLYFLRLSNRLTDLGSIIYSQQQAIYSYNPLLQIPIATTSYLQLLFWPVKLTLYHSEILQFSEVYLRSAILFVFILLIYYTYKKSRLVFFWLMFFVIAILPTTLPLGIASSIAERYVYLGSIGIITATVYYLSKIMEKKGQIYIIILFTGIIVSLSIRTIIRNLDWKTYESFWITTVKTSPQSYQAHNNVGIILARRGNLEESISEFKKSLAIVPNSMESLQNITIVYYEQKNYQKAAENLNMALKYYPNNTGLMVNLGIVFVKQGKKTEAQQILTKVLQINPNNKQAKTILAEISK